MSHFQFEKNVKDLTRMDGPLVNAPLMRWQRKAQETLLRVHPSDNGTSSPMKNPPLVVRSPGRISWTPGRSRTPGKGRTPGKSKTPGKNPITPKNTKTQAVTPGKHPTGSKKPAITPGKQQDRFIPNRATTDYEMSHFALMHIKDDSDSNGAEGTSASNASLQYKQHLTDAMIPHRTAQESKILSFKSACSVSSHPNKLNVLYSTGKVPMTKTGAVARQIPNKPEHVLDAPAVLDDYYLNTLDWGSTNMVATALGTDVYLWNATNSSVTLLMNTDDDEYISGVSWISNGSILGVGLSDGRVQLWDVNQTKLVRTMTGHAARVGCLHWNAHILTSGSRSGAIHHHDVRVAEHHVATLANHEQEVCGLQWSSCGRFLASGGNDNAVNVWDTSLGMEVRPLHTFTQHQAAIKAVSWCPWQPSLLATGGGSNDRHIRFWNTTSGTCIKAIDTESQVCSILWSKEHRELVSGHGYALNQLSLWKYPAMTKITDLTGHSGRILNLCLSPDGQTVASLAADETIRLWKCFAHKKQEKITKAVSKSSTSSSLSMCIR